MQAIAHQKILAYIAEYLRRTAERLTDRFRDDRLGSCILLGLPWGQPRLPPIGRPPGRPSM